MGVNSYSLFAATKSTLQLLRDRMRKAPEAELQAAIDLVESLWVELQAASDVLAAERQRYAEFFEFAPDAYVITDPQGEVREANRAARELLGAKPGELEGAPLPAFVPEAERAAFRARLVAARGRPEADVEHWKGSVCPRAGSAVEALFQVRPMKVRRKNADGLCWLIRRA